MVETRNLDALLDEVSPTFRFQQAAVKELTKLKALAALAEEHRLSLEDALEGDEKFNDDAIVGTVGFVANEWLTRYDAIACDADLGNRSMEGRHA